MTETTQSFFDLIFQAPEGFIKKLKKPLVKNKLKRKFESAFDNTVDSIMQEQELIREELENIENLDFNNIKDSEKKIYEFKRNLSVIKKFYKWIFWEEYKDVFEDAWYFKIEE